MIHRDCRSTVERALQERVAVLLSGLPRVGRSDLANSLAVDAGGLIVRIDAAHENERLALEQTNQFLTNVRGNLVIIDNIDGRALDAVIRLVRAVQPVHPHPRFLLLTSQSSLDHNIAQALTGLIRRVELTPIQANEALAFHGLQGSAAGPVDMPEAAPTPVALWNLELHWLRGGFPESLDSATDEISYRWRTDYIQALLGGDYSAWEIGAADRLDQVVSRIIQNHGQIFNEDDCRSDLGIDRASVRKITSMLHRIGFIRILPNASGKHPVLYVRDSGLFHAMRGIRTSEQLRGDRMYGHSWECFAAETLISAANGFADAQFYRDKDQNEIDLILNFGPVIGAVYAIEFKTSDEREAEQGYWRACDKLRPTHKMLIHSGHSAPRQTNGMNIVPLIAAMDEIRSICR